MGSSGKKNKNDVLWSLWLNEQEDVAAELLIEQLEKEGLLKPNPRTGRISRYKLLQFLVYNAIYCYKDKIFNTKQKPSDQLNDNNVQVITTEIKEG